MCRALFCVISPGSHSKSFQLAGQQGTVLKDEERAPTPRRLWQQSLGQTPTPALRACLWQAPHVAWSRLGPLERRVPLGKCYRTEEASLAVNSIESHRKPGIYRSQRPPTRTRARSVAHLNSSLVGLHRVGFGVGFWFASSACLGVECISQEAI